MQRETAQEGMKQLRKIERDLNDLKKAETDAKGLFVRGILSGAGWVVGSIVMVLLLGWVLAILGVIPGFGEYVGYFQSALDNRY